MKFKIVVNGMKDSFERITFGYQNFTPELFYVAP